MTKTEFQEVFNTYFDHIRRFLFYRIGDEEKASDMAQDLFVNVWNKRDTLISSNMKSLLFKMANDMAISEFRKMAVRRNYTKSIVYVGSETSVHDQLQYEETLERYGAALEAMPEIQRVTFLLSRNEELKYHEIAEMLGISVKAVEKRMSLALEFLRGRLLTSLILIFIASYTIINFLKN